MPNDCERKLVDMRYYIADTHFFHKNLIERMDNRPFKSIDEMNEYMINQWNSRVNRNDEVVILGDFSFGNVEQTNKLLSTLKGKLYMIKGNHDKVLERVGLNINRFEWIKDYAEINDTEGNNRRKVILSHYPIIMYNGQYRYKECVEESYVYMLHGHVHDTNDNKLLDKFKVITRNTLTKNREGNIVKIPCNIINCFCMFSGYVPLTLSEWIKLDNSRAKQ